MQDTIMPEDAEFPITYVYCDNCNPEWDPNSEDGSTFVGNATKAVQNGWSIRDFGHMCPLCSAEEARLDSENETSVLGLDEVLGMLTPKDA